MFTCDIKQIEFRFDLCRYRTRSGWRAHEAYVHTKQLDFKCAESGCSKAFFSEQELTVHKRKHSGELPFTCSFCGNRYISAHSLAQHEKAAHFQTEVFQSNLQDRAGKKPLEKMQSGGRASAQIREHWNMVAFHIVLLLGT